MVANVNPWIPPDPGAGVNRSKVYFFQHGHVAYQIKENDKCINLQANILSLHSEISLIPRFGISASRTPNLICTDTQPVCDIYCSHAAKSAFSSRRPYVLYLFFLCLHANMLETELATRNL